MTNHIEKYQAKKKDFQFKLENFFEQLLENGAEQQALSAFKKELAKKQREESNLIESLLTENQQLILEIEEKNTLISHIIEKHESERRNLWKDTLDSIEQLLYSFLLAIHALKGEPLSEKMKKYLHDVGKQINEKLDQLRHEALHLYPTGIEDFGPLRTIESYYRILKDLGKLTIEVEFIGHLERFSTELEVHLFRLLQSLLMMINKGTPQEKLTVDVKNDQEKIALQFLGENFIEKLDTLPEFQWYVEILKRLQNTVIEAPQKSELVIQIILTDTYKES